MIRAVSSILRAFGFVAAVMLESCCRNIVQSLTCFKEKSGRRAFERVNVSSNKHTMFHPNMPLLK